MAEEKTNVPKTKRIDRDDDDTKLRSVGVPETITTATSQISLQNSTISESPSTASMTREALLELLSSKPQSNKSSETTTTATATTTTINTSSSSSRIPLHSMSSQITGTMMEEPTVGGTPIPSSSPGGIPNPKTPASSSSTNSKNRNVRRSSSGSRGNLRTRKSRKSNLIPTTTPTGVGLVGEMTEGVKTNKGAANAISVDSTDRSRTQHSHTQHPQYSSTNSLPSHDIPVPGSSTPPSSRGRRRRRTTQAKDDLPFDQLRLTRTKSASLVTDDPAKRRPLERSRSNDGTRYFVRRKEKPDMSSTDAGGDDGTVASFDPSILANIQDMSADNSRGERRRLSRRSRDAVRNNGGGNGLRRQRSRSTDSSRQQAVLGLKNSYGSASELTNLSVRSRDRPATPNTLESSLSSSMRSLSLNSLVVSPGTSSKKRIDLVAMQRGAAPIIEPLQHPLRGRRRSNRRDRSTDAARTARDSSIGESLDGSRASDDEKDDMSLSQQPSSRADVDSIGMHSSSTTEVPLNGSSHPREGGSHERLAQTRRIQSLPLSSQSWHGDVPPAGTPTMRKRYRKKRDLVNDSNVGSNVNKKNPQLDEEGNGRHASHPLRRSLSRDKPKNHGLQQQQQQHTPPPGARKGRKQQTMDHTSTSVGEEISDHSSTMSKYRESPTVERMRVRRSESHKYGEDVHQGSGPKHHHPFNREGMLLRSKSYTLNRNSSTSRSPTGGRPQVGISKRTSQYRKLKANPAVSSEHCPPNERSIFRGEDSNSFRVSYGLADLYSGVAPQHHMQQNQQKQAAGNTKKGRSRSAGKRPNSKAGTGTRITSPRSTKASVGKHVGTMDVPSTRVEITMSPSQETSAPLKDDSPAHRSATLRSRLDGSNHSIALQESCSEVSSFAGGHTQDFETGKNTPDDGVGPEPSKFDESDGALQKNNGSGAGEKVTTSHEMKDRSKRSVGQDGNPASALLGHLGSTYEGLIQEDASKRSLASSDKPIFASEPHSSVEFFQSVRSLDWASSDGSGPKYPPTESKSPDVKKTIKGDERSPGKQRRRKRPSRKSHGKNGGTPGTKGKAAAGDANAMIGKEIHVDMDQEYLSPASKSPHGRDRTKLVSPLTRGCSDSKIDLHLTGLDDDPKQEEIPRRISIDSSRTDNQNNEGSRSSTPTTRKITKSPKRNSKPKKESIDEIGLSRLEELIVGNGNDDDIDNGDEHGTTLKETKYSGKLAANSPLTTPRPITTSDAAADVSGQETQVSAERPRRRGSLLDDFMERERAAAPDLVAVGSDQMVAENSLDPPSLAPPSLASEVYTTDRNSKNDTKGRKRQPMAAIHSPARSAYDESSRTEDDGDEEDEDINDCLDGKKLAPPSLLGFKTRLSGGSSQDFPAFPTVTRRDKDKTIWQQVEDKDSSDDDNGNVNTGEKGLAATGFGATFENRNKNIAKEYVGASAPPLPPKIQKAQQIPDDIVLPGFHVDNSTTDDSGSDKEMAADISLAPPSLAPPSLAPPPSSRHAGKSQPTSTKKSTNNNERSSGLAVFIEREKDEIQRKELSKNKINNDNKKQVAQDGKNDNDENNSRTDEQSLAAHSAASYSLASQSNGGRSSVYGGGGGGGGFHASTVSKVDILAYHEGFCEQINLEQLNGDDAGEASQP